MVRLRACVTRRANAVAPMDDGMRRRQGARVQRFDDDTIRGGCELFEQSGFDGLTRFDMGGSSGKMSADQAEAVKIWVTTTLPRSTRQIGAWPAKQFGAWLAKQVGAWLVKQFGLVYDSRSGLIALRHCLGLEDHKPEVISRKLDEKT